METATAAEAKVIWQPQPGSQVTYLTCPYFECIYTGTRGVGKDDALLMDYAQHVGQGFGAAWRGVIFRQTYKQLEDIIARTREWFRQIFPAATFKEAGREGFSYQWPTGEALLFRHVKRKADYWNYHGHEYPFVGWSELTTWADPYLYHALKSCCRSSRAGMPRKYRGNTNPWGPGHNWVKLYAVDPAPPGVAVADEHGNMRVRIRGHYTENRALLEADPEYPSRIAASATSDAQRDAWLDEDWDVVAGGMFDDVWVRDRHTIPAFAIPSSWRIDRAFDWGSAKPFSVGWWAESDGTQAPDGTTYPRGTLFRIGEWYGWDGKHPNTGIRLGERDIARGILERERAAGIADRVWPGPADTAIYDVDPGRESIGDVMEDEGVEFTRADKRPGSRKTGWERTRSMLKARLEGDREQPWLLVFDHCRQFIRTVPTLPRSDRDPDDVDTDAEDHIGDETRYRVLAEPTGEVRVGRFRI